MEKFKDALRYLLAIVVLAMIFATGCGNNVNTDSTKTDRTDNISKSVSETTAQVKTKTSTDRTKKLDKNSKSKNNGKASSKTAKISSQMVDVDNLPNYNGRAYIAINGNNPDFSKKVQPGDLIVAGENFGCGSSREQAPEIIKALGIKCVIAKSFARIFFRNSINNGLLLIENDKLHDDVKEGDSVTVTVNEDIDYNGNKYPIASLPDNLVKIIDAGGLVKAMRKLNGLD